MKQPKALFLLSAVQMWKFFSHYGNKALLVLYMIQALHFKDGDAFALYAVYGALFELGGIFGGIAADRYLGLRRAVMLGGWLMAAGHLCMALEGSFSLGLSLIVVGSSFFSTNIAALLGSFYEENDPLREKGYTLFYMVMNLGALISTILCPLLSSLYGWHTGFGLAAFGMLIANILLFSFRSVLDGKGEENEQKNKTPLLLASLGAVFACLALFLNASLFLPVLPPLTIGLFAWMAIKLWRENPSGRSMLKAYYVCLGALVAFFAMQEQIGSSLIVFTERMTSATLFGWEVPSTLIMSINPFTILLLGSGVAWLSLSLGKARLPAAFLISATSFLSLGLLIQLRGDISYSFVAIAVILLSVAELMIGPFAYSFASRVATNGRPGTIMGMIPISFSCSSLLGGALSNLVATEGTSESSAIYASGFTLIGIGAVFTAIVLYYINTRNPYEQNAVRT